MSQRVELNLSARYHLKQLSIVFRFCSRQDTRPSESNTTEAPDVNMWVCRCVCRFFLNRYECFCDFIQHLKSTLLTSMDNWIKPSADWMVEVMSCLSRLHHPSVVDFGRQPMCVTAKRHESIDVPPGPTEQIAQTQQNISGQQNTIPNPSTVFVSTEKEKKIK